jgi:hypothetical protein
MKSGLRTGILSDKSVLISCADQQSIPFNKINLAARSGTKISRPQKSIYMFNNLNLPQSQKEELINDFVLRSQKQRPLVIPPRQYSTLSLDKPDALVAQVATHEGGGVSADMYNQIVQQLAQSSTQLAQSSTQLTQTQNDLKLQQYTNTFMTAKYPIQKQVVREFMNAIPDDASRTHVYNTVFGVSNSNEFENRIARGISKSHMTQLAMSMAETILYDPNNTMDLDDHFSPSAIARATANL